ncbi:MAG: amino acid ABC transporter permease [Candidatus Eisenbacteria bacterium]|nr:amino acid ABC transporter permease [Candidatus Eisenbacteria bacterium]
MAEFASQIVHIALFLLPTVPQTIKITLVSFAFALLLGLLVGMLRIARRSPWNWIGRAYVDAIRGVPLLVWIFFIYFGLGRILHLPQFVAGVIAIGVCYSAYVGETFRAGIQAIPRGQWEAADSLGLSRRQAMRRVILPQAIRVVIPPIMNDFIACLKDSSLVSIIGLRELTRAGREYSSGTFVDFQTWLVVGCLYLVMTLLLTKGSSALESRLRRTEAA